MSENSQSKNQVSWEQFEAIELRVGTIIEVQDFPEARRPAFKLKVDFGDAIGIKRSSAQITFNYNKEELKGRQVIAITNFAPKQIGPFISECLVTGFADETGNVVLSQPSSPVPNGSKLY